MSTTNAPSPASIPSRRVLVVDDSVDITASMRLLLEVLGQEVRVAHDGRNALRIAKETPPDIVFLDLGLPFMDGYEVARALRVQFRAEALTIIALSGRADEKSRELSRAAGIDDHWLKPITMARLKALLSTGASSPR
jgi:CheY-like chemotaxis protein